MLSCNPCCWSCCVLQPPAAEFHRTLSADSGLPAVLCHWGWISAATSQNRQYIKYIQSWPRQSNWRKVWIRDDDKPENQCATDKLVLTLICLILILGKRCIKPLAYCFLSLATWGFTCLSKSHFNYIAKAWKLVAMLQLTSNWRTTLTPQGETYFPINILFFSLIWLYTLVFTLTTFLKSLSASSSLPCFRRRLPLCSRACRQIGAWIGFV